MKRLLFFMVLAVLFTLGSTTSVTAQRTITNDTSADITVSGNYGNTAACGTAGSYQVTVPAFTTFTLAIPANMSISSAKGAYVNSTMGCGFNLNTPCGGAVSQFVNCQSTPGPYTAKLDNNGVKLE